MEHGENIVLKKDKFAFICADSFMPEWHSRFTFSFSFIFKSLDATVSRLLAETRKLLEELEDAKCLDDIIVMLNSEIPVIHREWMYPITNSKEIPVDEGVIVRPESSVMVS